MISISTIEEMHRHSHGLALYCLKCDRWESVVLPKLIAAGRGSLKLVNAKFRCKDCGGIADKQLRPPAPAGRPAAA